MPNEFRNPLVVHDEKGAGSFNFGEALRAWEKDNKEWVQSMEILERAGLVRGQDMRVPTPRTKAEPPELPGFGDIHTQTTEPGQRYWEQHDTGRARPDGAAGYRPVAKKPDPIACPPVKLPPNLEGWGEFLNGCVIPVFRRLFEEHEDRLKQKLMCGTYFNQPSPHLAPPPSAIGIDVFTKNAGVLLRPGGAAAAPETLLSIDVPDRFIVILTRLGQAMGSSAEFNQTQWSMQRNETPLRSYGDFDIQLGTMTDPVTFPSPIMLKHKDQWRLFGRNTGVGNVTAFARVMGYAIPVRAIGMDGSWSEYHQQ